VRTTSVSARQRSAARLGVGSLVKRMRARQLALGDAQFALAVA